MVTGLEGVGRASHNPSAPNKRPTYLQKVAHLKKIDIGVTALKDEVFRLVGTEGEAGVSWAKKISST